MTLDNDFSMEYPDKASKNILLHKIKAKENENFETYLGTGNVYD